MIGFNGFEGLLRDQQQNVGVHATAIGDMDVVELRVFGQKRMKLRCTSNYAAIEAFLIGRFDQ